LANFAVFICYLSVVLASVGGNFSELGFLTPGLCERTGRAFWSAFFFELPFTLLRIVRLIFFAVVANFYGYWGLKANHIYRSRINEEEQ
jgi:hypothetical protein